MTTARSVVYRALRMMGVVDPEETPTSTMATNGLETLNAMVHAWKGQKVDVGHEDWDFDNDVTVELDPMHVDGMTALLVIAMLPEYPNTQLSPAVKVVADNGWEALKAAHIDSSVDSDLVVDRAFQGRRWGWR